MDGNRASRLLDDTQELQRNRITRCTSIIEKQLEMVEVSVGESLGIVDFLIQTDDGGDVSFTKIGKVRFGRM